MVVVVVEVKIDVNSFPRASLVEIVEIVRESSLEQDLDWRMSISFSLSHPSRDYESRLKKKKRAIVSKNSSAVSLSFTRGIFMVFRLFSSGIPCKPWKIFKRIEKYWLREARWGQADSLGSVFKAYRVLYSTAALYIPGLNY